MSKLACICGNVISDVLYPSPTEGVILRQQDDEPLQIAIAKAVAAFIQADRDGKRDEWLRDNLTPPCPSDVSDKEVVAEVVFDNYIEVRVSICECDNCGRLHVQRRNEKNVYIAFAPEQPGYHAVLTADRNEDF